jgi:tetratricopeptide (TPR) repeat protein
MTTTHCDLFRDELGPVIDGDEQAIERHLEHLADCDDCRDLRHEADLARQAVAAAGSDFLETDDLVARVLERIDSEAAAPVRGEAEGAPATPATARKVGAERADAAPRSSARLPWTGVAAAAALAVAAAAVGIVALTGGGDGGGPGGGEAAAALSATLESIDRAGDGEVSGIAIVAPGGAEREGDVSAKLAPGSIVRTDDRTRARLRLSDGSELTLDRGTEIELVAGAPRSLRLHTGELVAEVATVDGAPRALFQTAGATVEVLGTRFLLSAFGDHSSVRVSRGAVAMRSPAGRAEVRAGEEGVVTAGGEPEVVPASHLAEAMSFADLETSTGDGAAERSLSGIGELRAFKPGESRDRDWPLAVAEQKVKVRVAGNIARTEIEQTFRNDSDTTLEGVYKFPLPSDARIDRLALDVDGGFMEGAFVAKDRASKIWRGVIRRATPKPLQIAQDDIVWVPGPWRDPALLEWERGGRFELRIFPIPKRGARTIKIAYSQVLAPQGGSRRYVYPLAHAADGSTAVERFAIDFRAAGVDPVRPPRVLGYPVEPTLAGDTASLSLERRDFQPAGSFIVEYVPAGAGAELQAWTFRGDVAAAPTDSGGKLRGGLDPEVVEAQRRVAADARPTALIALRPKLPRWSEARSRDFVFVIDSSQSMVGERFSRASDLLAAAIGEMDRRDRVTVLACDVECRPVAARAMTPSATTSAAVAAALAEIEPAGASFLTAALERAAAMAAEVRRQDSHGWVVYVGDGMPSMGYRSPAALARRAETIAARHQVALSAVGIGGDADDETLGAIARAGGGHFLPWLPGQATATAAMALLETTYGVSLAAPELVLPDGLTDIGPARLPTIRAGDEVLVAARFSGEVKGDVILRGMVGGKKYENRFPVRLVASEAAGNAFVPRMWAALRIAELERQGRAEDRTTIIGLSKAYGVLSKHTSLLVLESEAMFRAFGVDRSAPKVSWTGEEEGGVEVATASGAIDFAGYGEAKRRAADKSAKLDDDLATGAGGAPMSAPQPAAGEAEAPRDTRVDRSRRPAGRGPGQWMRRVRYRVGAVGGFDGVHPNIIAAVARSEERLEAAPDSRERHRDLVQALSYAGELERAAEVARRWLDRDRFDPEALIYIADILARSGDRARGVRTLSGIADVDPDQPAFHDRLAAAYERSEQLGHACAHRVAAAEIATADAERLARAARCERALGRAADAEWLLSRAATDEARRRADELLARPASPASRRQHIEIEASWLGGSDLDVSLITPRGVRVSWMGGAATASASSALGANRERLAVARIPRGNYVVEISRTDAGDRRPIEGSLEVRVHGTRRVLPFRLAAGETRAAVGKVSSQVRTRMVPM